MNIKTKFDIGQIVYGLNDNVVKAIKVDRLEVKATVSTANPHVVYTGYPVKQTKKEGFVSQIESARSLTFEEAHLFATPKELVNSLLKDINE